MKPTPAQLRWAMAKYGRQTLIARICGVSVSYVSALIADLKGLCRHCGKPRGRYPRVCDACAVQRRQRRRRAAGCACWREGGPGRKPYVQPGV